MRDILGRRVASDVYRRRGRRRQETKNAREIPTTPARLEGSAFNKRSAPSRLLCTCTLRDVTQTLTNAFFHLQKSMNDPDTFAATVASSRRKQTAAYATMNIGLDYLGSPTVSLQHLRDSRANCSNRSPGPLHRNYCTLLIGTRRRQPMYTIPRAHVPEA
jgi:hypothetical protein